MYTFVLVFLMVLGFSFQSLFTRLYSASYEGGDSSCATPVFSIVYGFFIAASSFFLGGMHFSPSWQTLALGVLNAGMLVFYNTSMIEAGNRGPYSFLMVASMFGGILVPMLADVIFLGTVLRPMQLVAVALMLAALVLMNARTLTLKGASKAYYIWCIVLFFANGLYGAIMNLQAQVMNGGERTEMLTILYACSALFVIFTEIARKRGNTLLSGFRMGKKSAIFITICCISATAAANLMLYNLTLLPSGVLYTIDSGSVLMLSILYSLVLFKEKPYLEQLIGMAVAVGSIVLINLA